MTLIEKKIVLQKGQKEPNKLKKAKNLQNKHRNSPTYKISEKAGVNNFIFVL